MIFPVSVTFNKRLKTTVTFTNKQQILQYIKKSISDDKADNIAIEEMHVTYKGSTSNWRSSLYGTVDNGLFNLLYKDNCWWLSYQINMRELFLFTSIASAVMGIIGFVADGSWWIGLGMFLWLCGANWLTNLVRHGSVATDIADGIDELILGKPEPIEFDKMNGKLKSWF